MIPATLRASIHAAFKSAFDARWPRTAVTAVGFIYGVDLVFRVVRPPLPIAAVMDEAAHLATALLLVKLLPRPSPGLVLGVLVGSVAIDVDHVPMEFGWNVMTHGTYRPYSHSLLSIVVVGLAATRLRGSRRWIAAGVGYGLAAHFLRDMATGGLPLLWPVSRMNARIAYAIYAIGVASLCGWTIWRGWGGRRLAVPRAARETRTPDAG